jgi:hypothetical protein
MQDQAKNDFQVFLSTVFVVHWACMVRIDVP